ncbi:uroporphyrinogen-III synthase [Kordiimonas pumila]|uniref:Uroporphyrinogen-III synthase n=1 Tax=Kordiimonas pumila TaxID=2161677 RepID=A0ABV7D4T2_9PROT|nr:uroporphyrinogen-III synthase [Kordiimonas pumila]
MSTFLMTRPADEARKSGQKLESLGHRVVYAPMIKIEQVSFELPDESRSLIITSKNGARYGLPNISNKGRPIFAVGDQTALEARALGFTNVTTGPGTARQLIPLLLECGISQKREYTHLCGNNIAYDIADVLRQEGLDANNTVTYQAVPNRVFSPSVQEEMEHGTIDGVLFYSPRTATIFEETVSESDCHHWLPKLDAYCFSNRVADELLGPWKTISSAVLPTEKALFSLFE